MDILKNPELDLQSKNYHSIDGGEVCSFFIPRKHRFCKMKPLTGFKYCPQHSHLCPEQTSKMGIRIPCPLDPSHTCYLSRLEQHKKKCNARERDKPPYYRQNISSGNVCANKTKIAIGSVSDEELLHLIKKVQECFRKEVPPLAKVDSLHPFVKFEMEKVPAGTYSLKHLQQQASLLSAMDRYDLLNKGTCFIEFGAGKGQLMYWVILAHLDQKGRSYILVDRAAQRYKFDNKFKENNDIKVERIRIDIEHLYLGNIKCIKEKPHKIVGISKHLCGSATDLALRCMLRTLKSDEKDKTHEQILLGLVMAQCCHHRCAWNSYVGRDFLEKNGFNERDFQIMCGAAGWATCGIQKTNVPFEDCPAVEHQEDNNESASDNQINRYVKLGLPHSEREEIGRQCKRLIDMGRVYYLQQHNLISELVVYVDSSVSLENVALVAASKNAWHSK